MRVGSNGSFIFVLQATGNQRLDKPSHPLELLTPWPKHAVKGSCFHAVAVFTTMIKSITFLQRKAATTLMKGQYRFTTVVRITLAFKQHLPLLLSVCE